MKVPEADPSWSSGLHLLGFDLLWQGVESQMTGILMDSCSFPLHKGTHAQRA